MSAAVLPFDQRGCVLDERPFCFCAACLLEADDEVESGADQERIEGRWCGHREDQIERVINRAGAHVGWHCRCGASWETRSARDAREEREARWDVILVRGAGGAS